MAIATRTDSSLAANFTQASLIDAIKQGFTNAGFSNPVDEFTSGSDKNLVYSQIVDSNKKYGSNFIKVRLTTGFSIYQQIFTAWNPSNHSGENGSNEYGYYYGFDSKSPVNIVSLNGGNEYKFNCLSQGGSFWLLGILVPEKRPTWWDLNSFSYGFIPANFYLNEWRSSNVNPYSNSTYSVSLAYGQLTNPNPQTNKRDIMAGLLFYTQSNCGIACKTSDELVMCSANGIARYEFIQASGMQYLVVNPGAGGLAVRIS
ncbi:hypothetical protein BZZ01_11285 [Nostocales cyanobacterium HT-58-2]|nr:hypothetical protein BZZ01_11285 [Nostocales cyanobacterium HT-58-2]